ncbi:MAG: beta-lactamase family protein [Clostridia bacterium]|nr:beta-lactamase family protein [Clostridia bacterium]
MKKWKARAYRLALSCLPNPKRQAKVQGSVPEGAAGVLRRHHTRDGAVALFDAQGVTGLLTYGDVQPDTAYRTASISKHITAMAAWRLHEAGIIDIDADADAFLLCSLRHPKAPDTPVTLRRLLSHTAGIRDGSAYAAACSQSQPLGQVLAADSHTAEFGAFTYSNFGAGIVACVLEGMLGKSFETIIQEAVFGPLRITASFYPQKLTGEIANAYRVLPPSGRPALDAAARRARPLPPDAPDPERHYLLSQGNLYISVPELARLGAELMRERYAPMRRRLAAFGERDSRLDMGLGTFIVHDVCPMTLYGHQGLAYGAMHGLFYDPQRGRGFALLTTGCSEAREGVLSDINIAMMRLIFDGNSD